MFSISWMASAVAHDPGCLLALDIAVDTRHPGADLVREEPLTEGPYVIGPFADTRGSGFDPGQPALFRVPNDPGHPLDAVFRGARVVAEPAMRPHRHQHVRKALDEHADISLRPVCPDI